MNNIFLEFTEFIETDPRLARNNVGGSYKVDAQFQYLRHVRCLPPDLIKNKKVLDLGCCVGATGAWVLSAGAHSYVGVELQQKFFDQTVSNLNKRFAGHSWKIHKQSVQSFLQTNIEHFDIVIMFGILYQGIYFENLILDVLKTKPRHVLVDSVCPLLGLDYQTQQKLQNLPLIEYVENQPMISESGGTHIVNAARPSLSALQVLFWSNGYTLSINHTDYFQSIVPNVYPKHRYCVDFVQNDSFNLIDFETSYKFENKSVTSNFAQSEIQAVQRKQWSFESGVSEYFEQHARQHIPRYDEITDLCVNICKRQLPDLHSSILDVGCATGNTILKLKAAGFDNLVGVDASASMLAKVQHLDLAEWILSDQFPNQRAPYMAILCNWTLHFIKTKQNYLQEIYQNLHAGGLLILTEKTANSGLELSLYHDFKRSQGVSEQDIKNKAESLEHVMFIDSVDWYISTLKELGFGDIKIIDASPCFTTFLAFKPR